MKTSPRIPNVTSVFISTNDITYLNTDQVPRSALADMVLPLRHRNKDGTFSQFPIPFSSSGNKASRLRRLARLPPPKFKRHHRGGLYDFECRVGPCWRLLLIVLLLNAVMCRPPTSSPLPAFSLPHPTFYSPERVFPFVLCILVPMSRSLRVQRFWLGVFRLLYTCNIIPHSVPRNPPLSCSLVPAPEPNFLFPQTIFALPHLEMGFPLSVRPRQRPVMAAQVPHTHVDPCPSSTLPFTVSS